MNYLILGSGKMAEGIIHDLSRFSKEDKIYVCDVNEGNLENIDSKYKSKKLHTIIFDAIDYASYERLLDGIDIVISTLPYRFNYDLSKITVESKIHWVDLGGNLDIVNKQKTLHDTAKENNVCLVPDTGLAPGLVSIVSSYMMNKMALPKTLKIMVGGIPVKKDNPLNYHIVFSVNGLINEYIEQCIVLEGNEIRQKNPLEDLEYIRFPKPFDEMEAFNTSGGSSTLPYSFKNKLQDLSYKTIRYKGHRDLIKAMIDLGFADDKTINFNGLTKTNRELFEALLSNCLDTIIDDVVLSRISLEGDHKVIDAELIKYNDKKNDLSAMMICTGFPSSIIAQMIINNSIKATGFIYQERDIDPELFILELEKREIIYHFNERNKY